MRVFARTLVVAVLLIVAGCSSSDSDSANIVSFDDAVEPVQGQGANAASNASASAPPAQPAESAGAAPDAASADEFNQVIDVFDRYLSLRSKAITGDSELDSLASVATPTAIEQVASLRAKNDELAAEDSYGVLSNLNEWSNVTSISRTADALVFTDCTERQYVTPGGFTVIQFVTNDVTIVTEGAELKVDRVDEIQDGVVTLEPEEFGCVPPSFQERAENTARLAVEEAAQLIRNPAAALQAELPPVFVNAARADLQVALETLARDGLSRTADESVDFAIVGMDVNRPEFTVVVSVCRTYPTGRTFTDPSGAETITDLATGSSYEEWVYVQLDPSSAGDTAVDVAAEVEDRGPNCQGG